MKKILLTLFLISTSLISNISTANYIAVVSNANFESNKEVTPPVTPPEGNVETLLGATKTQFRFDTGQVTVPEYRFYDPRFGWSAWNTFGITALNAEQITTKNITSQSIEVSYWGGSTRLEQDESMTGNAYDVGAIDQVNENGQEWGFSITQADGTITTFNCPPPPT